MVIQDLLSKLLSWRTMFDNAEHIASNNFYIITDSINLNLDTVKYFIKLHEINDINNNK